MIEYPSKVPIKAWVEGVELDSNSFAQLVNISLLPIIFKHIAVMPDVHLGIGATVGSVIPTKAAIIPAAVGVDIGCGMMAVRTSLNANDLDGKWARLREEIESRIPVGGPGARGSWGGPGAHSAKERGVPKKVEVAWSGFFEIPYQKIIAKHPKIGERGATVKQLGSLGTGNHFIEVCRDEVDIVWLMLHSGSRGVGNRIGTYFIEKAKEEKLHSGVDRDLSWLAEGTSIFDDYVEAVGWAQAFAFRNRILMMESVKAAVLEVLDNNQSVGFGPLAVNCHHNYVQVERHFGEDVYVTRKGAVSAKVGELGIIPGSMGAKSFIVRGKGNPESFMSCSHGAGRRMSRGQAKRTFTVEDHAKATEGVECRKDQGVIDETPAAYKSIEAVMAAQADLVEIVHTLKQVVCVKG